MQPEQGQLQIILASKSPRRRQLIRLLGVEVDLAVADVDESTITIADPGRNAVGRAQLKAQAVAMRYPADGRQVVIGADTTVALAGKMLGKPRDAADAQRMLRLLRAQVHQVHTAIAVIRLPTWSTTHLATTDVTMRHYSDREIDAYIAGGDAFDKAGAYAIQHPTFRPVSGWQGCYAAVMGLSLCALAAQLRAVGVQPTAAIDTPCRTARCWQQQAYDPHFSA